MHNNIGRKRIPIKRKAKKEREIRRFVFQTFEYLKHNRVFLRIELD